MLNLTADLVFLSPKARIAALALAGLVSFAGTLPLLAALTQPGISTSNDVYEYFAQGTLAKPERLIAVNGFHMGDHGWYLDPGGSGHLVYRVPGYPGTRIGINLWMYLPEGITDSISVTSPGLPTAVVASNPKYAGDRLSLPAQYASASSVDVQIDAHNSSAAQEEVLDEVVTYSIHGDDPRTPPAYSFVAFGGLVALIAFIAVRRRPGALAIAAGAGLVVGVAAALRISALFLLHLNTDPDATRYRAIADAFHAWPPFDNGIFGGNFLEREPLFPMVVRMYFLVIGSSDFHERVVSATLSVAVVVVSIVAARRRLQTWWAPILVGLVVAISGPLIQESSRGLRLELETLLILGLYLALDRGPARRPLLDSAAIGLLGAAMALARTYFIPVFIAAVVISFFIRYRPLSKAIGLAVVSILIMGAAETAHRVGMYENHGNAFWDSEQYLRWNANEELFRFHRPLPHPELFPTLQQYRTLGTYAGPPISSSQYFLMIHSPVEVIRDSLVGSTQIFVSMDSFAFDVRAAAYIHRFPSKLTLLAGEVAIRFDILLRWMVVVGLMAMCLGAWSDRRLLIIPTMVATWLGLTAFLFNHGLIEQYRHTWQTFPLAMIAGAWLLERIAVHWWPSIKIRQVLIADVALFGATSILTLATYVHSTGYAAVAAVAALVGVLSYRRPAWGLGAAVLSIAAGGWLVGAAAALVSGGAVLFKLKPQFSSLVPVLAAFPLAIAIVISGGAFSAVSLEAAGILVGVVTAFAVVAGDQPLRNELVWVLAVLGPLGGVMAILHSSVIGVLALAPAGVVAAVWLYARGQRLALILGLVSLVPVLFLQPLAAWVGVAAAVTWLAIRTGLVPSSRRLLLRGGVAAIVAMLTALVAVAAMSPPATAPWSTRLDSPTSSVRQDIVVDRPGDNSIWIYARRSTALPDFPFSVVVNGVPVTSDFNSGLPTDLLTWNRVPLGFTPHVGDRLEVKVVAGGQPNATDRFIEIGGVYAVADGISSPGVNGTYLIILGDDSLPLAPGDLPEPMVRDRLQLPMGAAMPGEFGAATESREEAGFLQVWRQVVTLGLWHPLGTGTGKLGPALQAASAGLGPGLTARSELLQAPAEWGALGFAGLVLLLGVAAWRAWRRGDLFAIALLALAGIMLVGESLLADPAGSATVWLAVGFGLAAIGTREREPSTSPASDGETRPETSPREAIRAG